MREMEKGSFFLLARRQSDLQSLFLVLSFFPPFSKINLLLIMRSWALPALAVTCSYEALLGNINSDLFFPPSCLVGTHLCEPAVPASAGEGCQAKS